MRVVLQRVSRASVAVVEGDSSRVVGEIDRGLLALVGVRADDVEADAIALAEKVANLRIFEDAEGKLNLSLLDVGGVALAVSNFTLYGDCRKGRRPSFTEAASGERANALYEKFCAHLRSQGVVVQTGEFGAKMAIQLVNDGPVTLLLDSRKLF